MSEIKLKPCPFCGNSDRRVGIRRVRNSGYKVVCGNCGASGTYITIKEWHDTKMIAQGQAIKAWNRRHKEVAGYVVSAEDMEKIKEQPAVSKEFLDKCKEATKKYKKKDGADNG